jgi:hypothetical protein
MTSSRCRRGSVIPPTWPRLGAREYLAPARACLKYDVSSRPLLFRSVVFPLIRSRVQRSPAGNALEHTRIETAEIDLTLTSRPSLAAFAEWARKLPSIDGWLAQRRHLAAIYRRRLGHRMVGADIPEAILAGSCFVNFPVIVPQDRGAEVARAMMLAGYDVGRSLYPNVHRHPKFRSVSGMSARFLRAGGSNFVSLDFVSDALPLPESERRAAWPLERG